jgi:predicted transcriptional regulator
LWKIDTTKTGIEAVLKPYQYGIITYILDKKENITSSEMHAHLEFQGYTVSRASVINYLKKLAESGIIGMKQKTGKGGYHGVYSAKLCFEEILTKIVTSAMNSLLAAFPDSDFMKYMASK